VAQRDDRQVALAVEVVDAKLDPAAEYNYTHDALGRPLTTIANHRVYDAYGNVTSETNAAVDCIFGYTGKLSDESTGLQNNWRRWYDANTGRWANPACNPTFNVYPSTAGRASSGTRRRRSTVS